MGWVTAPVTQDGNSTWTWTISGFNFEPGGVVMTAEALGDLTTVTSTNSGSHQPNFAEAQINNNPYKTYQLDVTSGPQVASFYLIGVG